MVYLKSIFDRLNVHRFTVSREKAQMKLGRSCLADSLAPRPCRCEECTMERSAEALKALYTALEEAVTVVESDIRALKARADGEYNRARDRGVVSTMEKMRRILESN